MRQNEICEWVKKFQANYGGSARRGRTDGFQLLCMNAQKRFDGT
jgi:hypothetical protein